MELVLVSTGIKLRNHMISLEKYSKKNILSDNIVYFDKNMWSWFFNIRHQLYNIALQSKQINRKIYGN